MLFKPAGFLLLIGLSSIKAESLSKLDNDECVMGIKPNRLSSLIKTLTSDLLSEILHKRKKSEYPTSTLVTLPCPENMQEIDDMEDVQFIARNTKIRASALQVNPPNDGLARISHKEPNPSNEYVYTSYLGQGVDVYVLDSGINVQHSDFDNRARLYNFVKTEADADLYGHGSHVSGIIGGRTYGVAKKCNIKGVKILDRVGAGDAYVAIEAIHWVINEAAKSGNPSVINLSLEGETNKGLNEAIQLAYANGIAVIGAAGNSHRDACDYSPASSPYAFAVGSINRANQIDAESNYGQCVRLFAPGDRIISTGNTGTSSQLSYTGTSQAAPHVAGIAAIYLSQIGSLTPKNIYDLLVSKATPGIISGPTYGSPNLVAYSL